MEGAERRVKANYLLGITKGSSQAILAMGCLLFVTGVSSGCTGCNTQSMSEADVALERGQPMPPAEHADESSGESDADGQQRGSEPTEQDARDTDGRAGNAANSDPADVASSPRESGASGSGKGSPGRPYDSPAAARNRARELQQQAAAAEEKKAYGKAFDLTTQAFEAVSMFPGDPECSQLATQLSNRAEALGRQANSASRGPLESSRTLIEK